MGAPRVRPAPPGFVPFIIASAGRGQSKRIKNFRRPPCLFRARLLSQISMSLANLVTCRFFFSPSERKLYARSQLKLEDCYSAGVGRRPLPRDARLVGRYEFGIPAAAVLEDLEDLLTS